MNHPLGGGLLGKPKPGFCWCLPVRQHATHENLDLGFFYGVFMAGDWIKMRQDLHEDPAVVQIALLTDIDEDSVVGKLHKLWCWADKHTTDGTAPAITKTWVDRYVSKSGFAEAMNVAGWISFSDSGVLFPSFAIHNGHSAKSRAEASVRQRLSRKNRDEGVTGVDRTSIPKPFVRHVLNRDNYTCVYCGTESDEATEASRKSRLSIDHIIPETRGGSASVANLACCCRKCNNEKNDRTPEEWGLEPTFLQDCVTYKDGQMSHKNSDTCVTKSLPEKRREETEKKKRREETPVGFQPPDWINSEHWTVWHQCEKRRNATDGQKQLSVDKLAAWRSQGLDYAGALENAAAGGYQGLFLPDIPKEKRYLPPQPNETIPAKHGIDPALAKLNAEAAFVNPPSPEMREKLEALKRGVLQ